MKNSTNILLIVVIILLVALFVDKRSENNTLRADSGGAIDHVIFATDPTKPERFYMVNVANSLILYYEFDQSSKSILLKSARQFDYDSKVIGSYASKSNQGDNYEMSKSLIENSLKPKPGK